MFLHVDQCNLVSFDWMEVVYLHHFHILELNGRITYRAAFSNVDKVRKETRSAVNVLTFQNYWQYEFWWTAHTNGTSDVVNCINSHFPQVFPVEIQVELPQFQKFPILLGEVEEMIFLDL